MIPSTPSSGSPSSPLNAFCVDLEDWFHILNVDTACSNPESWGTLPSHVEADTEVLLDLLDEAGVKGTFLVLGWLTLHHAGMIRQIAERGHEIGCHGFWHNLVYRQSPEEFRSELRKARAALEDLTGRPITVFRAPGFSIKNSCFWAFEILAEEGFHIDISVFPAARQHGGVPGFTRDPFVLATRAGDLTLFPMSIGRFFGRRLAFSGGGYLRLFPAAWMHRGFRQNHRENRPVMTYIHPREVNPDQPRIEGLPPHRRFMYYVGLSSTQGKLREMLRTYRFATVTEALAERGPLPRRRLVDGQVMDIPLPDGEKEAAP